MFGKLLPFFLVALICTTVWGDGPQLLLLTNGQVVTGKVKRQDANYVVVKESGSRILFPVDRVKMVCSNWNELYWEKCAILRATDVAGHTELFNWCIDKQLVGAAQNQIDLLQHMEISAKQLHRLDDTLNNTRQEIAARLKRKAQALVEKAEAVAAGKRDYQVKQAGFFEEGVGSNSNAKIDGRASQIAGVVVSGDEVAGDAQAIDPFDPEVFNEKFVRQSQSKVEPKPEK